MNSTCCILLSVLKIVEKLQVLSEDMRMGILSTESAARPLSSEMGSTADVATAMNLLLRV